MSTASVVTPVRDLLWEHCRNSLGIARLLAQEQRSPTLIATACHMAEESACRAALEQAGLPFDGDLEHSMGLLTHARRLGEGPSLHAGMTRLEATETTVAWIASHLKRLVPSRSWSF